MEQEKIKLFEFATATRIIFGSGSISQLGSLASEMGKRAFVVSGLPAELTGPVLDQLAEKGLKAVVFGVVGEPTTHLVMEGTKLAQENACDMVIGFGGGSAMDTAKAIAALMTNRGELLDYLEVIGQNRPITKRSAPFIAIPTTAGTGAEVTRNAVMASSEQHVKVSLRSPLILAHVALVDPVLTYSMPLAITASTGLDALTQVIEPFVSNATNPLTDALCREGMQRAARSLRTAYQDGTNPTARQDMALASLFGGLALANAKLGAVHGFAAVLGGMYSGPHGAICASLLPHVMAVNVRALRQREPHNPSLERYQEVTRILTGKPSATLEDGITMLQDLVIALEIPSLTAYGVKKADFPMIIEKAMAASSMKGNPIQLTLEELDDILNLAIFIFSL
jgi:alcohol dehydrogenase class IV